MICAFHFCHATSSYYINPSVALMIEAITGRVSRRSEIPDILRCFQLCLCVRDSFITDFDLNRLRLINKMNLQLAREPKGVASRAAKKVILAFFALLKSAQQCGVGVTIEIGCDRLNGMTQEIAFLISVKLPTRFAHLTPRS